MTNYTYNDKIGILDPYGENPNPLTTNAYSETYKKLAQIWMKYPAYSQAETVLNAIADNQILFVQSGTGSGKTVLIPKFALHYTAYAGKIAVTLPKRNVTVSAATFAAVTLDVVLGHEVGYIYKGSDKSMYNHKNRIIYMTDGTLIVQILNDPLLMAYKIIIVDEAHERKVQIDLLMLLLKNLLLSGKRPDLRIIIMSATIDTNKYKNYFNGINSYVLNISGQPNYDIDVQFANEHVKSYLATGSELIDNLIEQSNNNDTLFFITTSNEALQLCKAIRPRYPQVYCIEVYADMDRDLKIYAETRDKFLELGNYNQKLIMATNVAESSVTIDGLKTVIDSGYELHTSFDAATGGKIYERQLITRAQALQRRGRVGRTEPGTCYHLLTRTEFNNLAEYPDPDILQQDITLNLLTIIQLTPDKTYTAGLQMLSELMDVPDNSFIKVAHDLYKLYKIIDDDGRLTQIGYEITKFSNLPLNRSLFLIYSYQLHCAREAAIIIAMLEVTRGKISSVFYKADTICESGCAKPSSKKLISELTNRRGDHLTLLNIYQKYNETSNNKAFARKYGIRDDIMHSAKNLMKQYYYRILNVSKAPIMNRVKKVDTTRLILQALKLSHRHLIAKGMHTIYPSQTVTATISKESSLNSNHKKSDLIKSTIIFDELNKISDNWEFNVATII